MNPRLCEPRHKQVHLWLVRGALPVVEFALARAVLRVVVAYQHVLVLDLELTNV